MSATIAVPDLSVELFALKKESQVAANNNFAWPERVCDLPICLCDLYPQLANLGTMFYNCQLSQNLKTFNEPEWSQKSKNENKNAKIETKNKKLK